VKHTRVLIPSSECTHSFPRTIAMRVNEILEILILKIKSKALKIRRNYQFIRLVKSATIVQLLKITRIETFSLFLS